MANLNESQLQAFRTTLEERKEQLLSELDVMQDRHLQRMQQASGHSQDGSATQANRMALDTVRDAEARRDHDELVAVRAALQRIDDGSYGECIDCGEDITLPRLEVFPAALRCIACQAKHES